MRIINIAAFITVLLTLCACSSSGSINKLSDTNTDNEIEETLNINFNEMRQEIDGFGGSNAWTRLPDNPQVAANVVRLLYSRTEGMGFTILRNRIPFRERLPGDNSPGLNDGFMVRKSDHTYSYTENPNGTKTFDLNWNSWDLSATRNLIRMIKNLGRDGPEELVLMSTPWTPPSNRVTQWKEDVTGLRGNLNYAMDWSKPDVWGRLKREHYNDYADLLADYAANFQSQMGHPLSILSVQNEPNWKVDYESAYWSGTDLRDFIKVIANRFPMKNVAVGESGLGIMMPEFENFNINFNEMILPSLDDPVSRRVITHIGLHQYNGASDPSMRAGAIEFPGIIESGKRFWQTEVSGSGAHLPRGTGIDNALYYARMIHWDMTLSQTNAFLFWWLWTNNSSNTTGSLIIADGNRVTAHHRLYAMGQFSRFVRPGWRRIECDASSLWGVFLSAYRNPKTKEIAIVIINDRYAESTISLNLPGGEFDRLDVWRTSESEKLEPLGRQRTTGGKTDILLMPKTMITLYGRVK